MERIAKSVSDFAQTYDAASAAVSRRPYRSPMESQPGLRRRVRALWKSLVEPLAALILLVVACTFVCLDRIDGLAAERRTDFLRTEALGPRWPDVYVLEIPHNGARR